MMFKIGNKEIGEGFPNIISFEPGATYSNIEEAKQMIDYVAKAGADAVKFQTFLLGDADRIMAKKDITVEFGTSEGKKQELVYDALKRRELSNSQWEELMKYSKKQGLLFITAPYFTETVDFLQTQSVDALKVSKGDINNVLLIEKMAQTNLPIILDAREKSDDVKKAVEICEQNNNFQIVVMHCPSGYPVENSGVHLNAITQLIKDYKYPIGFADHSPGDMMNYAAISLGAKMLEKTITLDKQTEHVEHFMSLEMDELKKFVNNIRILEKALGTGEILKASRVEESARRSIVARNDIPKDKVLTKNDFDFRRPGNLGISVSEGFSLIGKKTKREITKNTFLQWDMVE